MNVIAIGGGLGNQMFQYAFGQLMRKRTGEEVRYDMSTFIKHKRRRSYGLGEFICEPTLIDGDEAMRLYRPGILARLFGRRPTLKYVNQEDIPDVSFDQLADARNVYLEGYFQDPDCCLGIREQLCADFTLRNPPQEFVRKAEELSAYESVAVHVRRGDYVALGMTEFCTAAYYERAARKVSERVPGAKFFVFSDDLAWARENLSFLPEVSFVTSLDASRPALDMMLMKSCRHNVIANSTFSWWSAFLNGNPNKVVVAPAKWSANVGQKDKCPKEWVRA